MKALMVSGIVLSLMLCASLAALADDAESARAPAKGQPSADGTLAAEKALAQALLANDDAAIGNFMAPEWVVVSARGRIADRESFLAVIPAGGFSRTSVELGESRVRLYGNVAVVTVRLATAGQFQGKIFDIHERETDVFQWRDGRWQAVLSHETRIPDA